MDFYVKDILPTICKQSDDQNYGSSATKDIEALQALSKRIHFGKFFFCSEEEHMSFKMPVKIPR